MVFNLKDKKNGKTKDEQTMWVNIEPIFKM